MIIDKNKLHEAKEKIGDDAADIIADLLSLQRYDSKNRKSLCPFHEENTPSFIWNPKGKYFKCFGCGKRVSLIDAYMHTGLTFTGACEKVFEKAHIPYAFGEHGVRTKSDYRYPREENDGGNRDTVYAYMASRHISKETLDALDVRQDPYGNVIFNYYDSNDVLTLVKYKLSHKPGHGESKSWCQKGADTAPLLFNMNRVNFEQPLLITEGEPDTLAAIEAGYTNTVSVPFGANNYTWIEYNWDWLEQFDSIILAMDNDEPGAKAQKEIIYRLGSWRTKVMDIPETFTSPSGTVKKVKDVNEFLYYYGKSAVLSAITNAKDTPVPSVVDFSEVEDLDLSRMDGVLTGFSDLDRELMKLFYGTLTILSGTPSAGKSSFINCLIANAMEQGVSTFLYSKEMPERISSNWLMYLLAGERHIQPYYAPNNSIYYNVPSFVKKAIHEWAKGKLYIYKDDQPNDVESVKQGMTDCVRKYGTHLCIIDNLMMLNLGGNEDNRFEKQTELVNWLISFAIKYNVAVVLVAHPRKIQDVTADIGIYDVSGSSNIINLAHRSIGLRRITKREKEDPSKPFSKYDVLLTVIKDRFLGKSEFQMGFYFDFPSRRFFTNYDEYAHQYAWDKETYKAPIKMPECLVDRAEELYSGAG